MGSNGDWSAVSKKKAFGSADLFGEKTQGPRAPDAHLNPSLHNAQAFGSDDFFGRDEGEPMGRDRADEVKIAARVALHNGTEAARQGLDKARNMWNDYLKR